jgi:hypothetical protein
VGKDIIYLVPTIVINQTDLNQVTKGLMSWQIDMPSSSSLLSELKLWQQHWVHRHTLQGEIPSDLHTSLAICDEDIYPNIHVLLKIGCTLPISTCEAERSFSCYRRVKTHLRSSMNTERLAGLTLMHLHDDVDIDIDDICQNYITRHNRRMFQSCILYD